MMKLSKIKINILESKKVKIVSAFLMAASIAACLPVVAPTEVKFLSEFGSPRPYDVEVANGIAYVTSNTQGFVIFDVNNPASPKLISQISEIANPKLNKAVDLKVVGSNAFVGGVGGLVILDVSNPASPTEISFTPISNIRGIRIVGNLAFVLGLNDGLYTFDISNPASPTLVSLHPYSELNFITMANGLVVEGRYAYLRSHSTGSQAQGVEIIDISNPSSPVTVGGFPTNYTPGVLAKGNSVFLMNPDGGTMQAYDVSNASQPKPLGSFTDAAGVAFDRPAPIAIEGNLMYVWSKSSSTDPDPAGIAVLDITNTKNIKHARSLFDDATMRLDIARSVNKFGNKLYLPSYYDDEVEILELK